MNKIIGVGSLGIEKLNSIKNDLEEILKIESIDKNQNVDKDFVRELLDDVEVLYLVYDNEDVFQIVNAISFMAKERNILSIGLCVSENYEKKESGIDKELKYCDEFVKTIKFIENSMNCDVEVDLSDIKEVFGTDKDLLYISENGESLEEIIKNLKEKLENKEKLTLTNQKRIIFIEGNIEIEKVFDIYSELSNENSLFSFKKTENDINIGIIEN